MDSTFDNIQFFFFPVVTPFLVFTGCRLHSVLFPLQRYHIYRMCAEKLHLKWAIVEASRGDLHSPFTTDTQSSIKPASDIHNYVYWVNSIEKN